MVTLGGTWYSDAQKLRSASVLSRYEINSKKRHSNITPGNGLSVDWGEARQIGGCMQLGLVGYYQEQTSKDSGTGTNDLRPRRNAVGVQFDHLILSHGPYLKFAAYGETSAREGAIKGSLVHTNIVKAF